MRSYLLISVALVVTGCVSTPTAVMELSHPKGLGSTPKFVKATVGDSTVFVGDGEQTDFDFSPSDAQLRVFVSKGDVPLAKISVDIAPKDATKDACFALLGEGIPQLPKPSTLSQVAVAPAEGANELAVLLDVGKYAVEELCTLKSSDIFRGELLATISIVDTKGKTTKKFPFTLTARANCGDHPKLPCP